MPDRGWINMCFTGGPLIFRYHLPLMATERCLWPKGAGFAAERRQRCYCAKPGFGKAPALCTFNLLGRSERKDFLIQYRSDVQHRIEKEKRNGRETDETNRCQKAVMRIQIRMLFGLPDPDPILSSRIRNTVTKSNTGDNSIYGHGDSLNKVGRLGGCEGWGCGGGGDEIRALPFRFCAGTIILPIFHRQYLHFYFISGELFKNCSN